MYEYSKNIKLNFTKYISLTCILLITLLIKSGIINKTKKTIINKNEMFKNISIIFLSF